MLNQLCLLEAPPIAEPRIIAIEPVPDDVALGANRFYVVIRQGDRAWNAGIQLTQIEARAVLASLPEFANVPEIYSANESLLGGAL